MKNVHVYSQEERLKIVVEIVSKLKSFPTNSNYDKTINLYNSEYPAIVRIKAIFKEYIHNGHNQSGVIKFPELGKKIEYILPTRKGVQPLFVFRHCL
jgi:hypothetical protein